MASTDSRRYQGRQEVLSRSVDVFRAAGATDIHVFGSIGRGADDALSDLDLWITIDDAQVAPMTAMRHALFRQVAPVVVTHEARQNRPLGGSYSLVIHETASGLYQVDYYLAPRSTSVVLPEARRLYGNSDLPTGSWLLDATALTPTSLEERIDFLTCMSFIGVKKVIRGDEAFISFLLAGYHRFITDYGLALESLPLDIQLDLIETLLCQLARIADTGRQHAIRTIVRRYVHPAREQRSHDCQ